MCGALGVWLAVPQPVPPMTAMTHDAAAPPLWCSTPAAGQGRPAPANAAPAYVQLLHAAVSASGQLLHEGRVAEALQVLQAGDVVVAEPGLPAVVIASFRVQLARTHFVREWLAGSRPERAFEAIGKARVAVGRAGDDGLKAEYEELTGLVLYWRASDGDLDRAMTHIDYALSVRQRLEDSRGFAESLISAAMLHAQREDADPDDRRRSLALLDEALELAGSHGHALEEATAARYLAGMVREQGDLDRALELATRSLTLAETTGHRLSLAPSLLALGDVWMARGDHKAARALYEDALAAAGKLGSVRFEVDARLALSRVEERRGETDQARRQAQEALRLAREAGYAAGVQSASARAAELDAIAH
jgi:tetratricopeptide (TPR) repeat protein